MLRPKFKQKSIISKKLRVNKAIEKIEEDKTLIAQDTNMNKGRRRAIVTQKEDPKKKEWKNPYYKIINMLPKEIQSKIDWKKKNFEDMFKALTPPHE